MSNTIGYSLGCVIPVRFNLTQGEDTTGNGIGFSLPSCAPLPVGDEVVTLSTVSQSSTPTLIGFSELFSPSVPPRKYRRKTGWGDASRISRFDSCAGPTIQGSDRYLITGYDYYTVGGVLVTDNSHYTAWQDLSSYPPTTIIAEWNGLPSSFHDAAPINDLIWTFTDSPTLHSMVAYQCGYTTTLAYSTPDGGVWIELSDEDMEADAIARAVKTPGTGAVASRTARTTGFGFDLTTVEATLHCSNMDASLRYRVSYDVKATNLNTSAVTLTPYEVDVPAFSTSYDLDAVTLSPNPGFSLELVNYTISTR